MDPVSPVIPGRTLEEHVAAKDQPEYRPLPFIQLKDGSILTRWKLTADERKQIAETGDLYLFLYTFGKPIQPLRLQTEVPIISTGGDGANDGE